MSVVHTSIVTDAHAYTRERVPWIIGEHKSVYGKLIHYLSGGGMQTFGRTVRQEEVAHRRFRFLTATAVLSALWLALWLF